MWTPSCPDHSDTGESPIAGLRTFDAAGCSEALLIACMLAGWGNPLAGTDFSLADAERLLPWVLVSHVSAEIVGWAARVPAAQWRLRWRWAVATVRRVYPHVAGVQALPGEWEQAAPLLSSAVTGGAEGGRQR